MSPKTLACQEISAAVGRITFGQAKGVRYMSYQNTNATGLLPPQQSDNSSTAPSQGASRQSQERPGVSRQALGLYNADILGF